MERNPITEWLVEAAALLRDCVRPSQIAEPVLLLALLKRISDVFDDEIERLSIPSGSPTNALADVEEDRSLVRYYVPETARWSRLRSCQLEPHEGIAAAVRALSDENPRLRFLTTENFSDCILRIERGALGHLIHFLSSRRLGLEIKPSTVGAALATFLDSAAAKGLSSTAPPAGVAALLARLLNPLPGMTIYDPCCGSGSLLIHCHLRCAEAHPEVPGVRLSGQEIDPTAARLATMSAAIHEAPLNIVVDDALRRPRFLDKYHHLWKFDLSLSNPPRNRLLPNEVLHHDPYHRFPFGAPPKRRAEWAWVQHMVSSLKPNGRMAVVMSLAALSRGSSSGRSDREKAIRHQVLSAGLLEAIILLPSNLFPGTTAATCAVLFNKARRHPDQILMVNASEEVRKENSRSLIASEQIARIAAAYEAWADDGVFSKVVSRHQLIESDCDLSPLRHLASGRVRRLAAAIGHRPTPLSEVIGSINLAKRSREAAFVDMPSSIYLPMIGRSDAVSSLDQLRLKPHNYAQLVLKPGRLDSPEYIAGFFNTPLGLAVRDEAESGGVIPKLTKASIQSMHLYLPSPEQQTRVVLAASRMRELKSELEEIEQRMWSDPRRLNETTRRLSRFGREEGFVEWLEVLPFPLASILWHYHTLGQDHKLRYECLLHYFEALAQFFAVVLLSATSRDPELLTMEKPRYSETLSAQNLSLDRSSFGAWRCLVESLAKLHRTLLNSSPANRTRACELLASRDDDVLGMLTSKKLIAVLSEANSARNSWHGHGGLVSRREAERRHTTLRSLLSRVRASFGTAWDRYRLLLPESMTYRKSSPSKIGGFTHRVRLVHRRSGQFEQMEVDLAHALEEGQMYLWSPGEREALKLLPLVPKPARWGFSTPRWFDASANDDSACLVGASPSRSRA